MEIKQIIIEQDEKSSEVTLVLDEEEIKFFVDLGLTTAMNIFHTLPLNIAVQIANQTKQDIIDTNQNGLN